MKTESIEALLLDRSLGELNEETCELLDDYLAQHPAARTEAEAIDRAVQLSRQLLVSACVEKPVLPPLDSPRRPDFRQWTQVWPLAACLALGVLSGRFLSPYSPAPSPRGNVVSAHRTTRAETAQHSSLWSVAARLSDRQARHAIPPASSPTPRRLWEMPTQRQNAR